MSELYPGSYQIPAMLISKTPPEPKLSQYLASKDYIGTVKKDGYFYELEYTPTGEIYLFSRSKSRKTGELTEKISNVPHIKEWAKTHMQPGTILIGEIYYPGKTSKDVTKIMGSLPAKAAQRQFDTKAYGGPIHYYIHDMIYRGGEDLTSKPYEYRLYELMADFYSPEYDYIEFVETYYEDLSENLKEVFDRGEEGMVFKKKNGLYLPGKRPTDNFKVKTEETFDCIIVGFIEPEKEYTGKEIETWEYWDGGIAVTKAYYNHWKAGIEVAAYDAKGNLVNIGTISSGMTDFWRKDMAENPNSYLGKVVEIQAMSVDAEEHSIRHGRLMRIRDDKPASECTLESIFGK